MPRPLTLSLLQTEAAHFAKWQSGRLVPALFGMTDEEAVSAYLTDKFQARLARRFSRQNSDSAHGIAFPLLNVDTTFTNVRQPQSLCPFRGARQKIYGLGYSLIVFAYEKHDDAKARAARLDITQTIFVDKIRTADFQTSSGLLQLITNKANRDDILEFFAERRLPVSDLEALALADEVLSHPPTVGYLTMSTEYQWRLRYRRSIEQAGKINRVKRLTLPSDGGQDSGAEPGPSAPSLGSEPADRPRNQSAPAAHG